MVERQNRFFEKDRGVGQVDYPFRIGGTSFFRTAFETLAKPMVAIMTFGALPLGLLLFGIHLVPRGAQTAYAWLMGFLVIASVPLSWTFRVESLYRLDKGTFEKNVVLFGRKIRSWVWPGNLFNGISYGHKGLTRGRISVVRLKCKIDGYLVDSFLHADHIDEAEELARKLSGASGLPLLGEEFTGQQHELNDLRRHAWLTAKYGKANP